MRKENIYLHPQFKTDCSDYFFDYKYHRIFKNLTWSL